MGFVIEKETLAAIKIPNVKLDSITESKTTADLTLNCGCGGTCLSTTT